MQAKGSYGSGLGDELLTWVPIVGALREYADALRADAQPKPLSIRQTRSGQYVVDVFPSGLEALLWGGFRGEVYIVPGKEPTQGTLYKQSCATPGGIALVLGAGNQQSVAALDILHMMLMHNAVVICKMNPVNEYMGPFLEKAFKPLVDKGLLQFCYGGAEVGKYLCEHPSVKSIHLTGSAATYDAIVWQGQEKGPGKTPPLDKPVSAELGCVTPYIIVPGPWSKEDMEYHAENIAAALTNNSGHNCVKAEIIVTDKGWTLRDNFLEILRQRLSKQPVRVPYYPGSAKKYEGFKKKFNDAEELGRQTALSEGDEEEEEDDSAITTMWLLKAGLTPETAQTQDENWCGVLQEVALDGCGGDPARFLEAATSFANDRCWGTLGCDIAIHPSAQKQCDHAYQKALLDLKYGSIAVNCPGLVAFSMTTLGWGAYGGRESGPPHNIGSGNCMVHNTSFFDHIEKNVLTAPFRFYPYPIWSGTNRNTEAVARALLEFTARPRLVKLLPLARHALVG